MNTKNSKKKYKISEQKEFLENIAELVDRIKQSDKLRIGKIGINARIYPENLWMRKEILYNSEVIYKDADNIEEISTLMKKLQPRSYYFETNFIGLGWEYGSITTIKEYKKKLGFIRRIFSEGTTKKIIKIESKLYSFPKNYVDEKSPENKTYAIVKYLTKE
ncbi:MAG: hypothetical protein ACP5NV_04415 [Candidatus Woesearchaeota archaeon]